MEKFGLRYPMLNIIGSSLVLSLIAFPLSWFSPDIRPLPLPSVAAFLFALGCLSFPVQEALRVERTLPDCPPFWRVRYDAVYSAWFYIFFCLLTETFFPSFDAVGTLIGATVFGAGMTWAPPGAAPVADLFETERPVLHGVFGRSLWLVWGGVQVVIAVCLSLVASGGTALAVFIMVVASGLVIPYRFRNHTRWHERDLLTVLGFAAATAGLFLA